MLGLLGLGVGALQGAQQAKQAERDRQLQAQTALWSPWTGMAPQKVQEANMLGSIAGGGLTGAGLDQNMAAAKSQDAMNSAQLKKLGAETDYLNSLTAPPPQSIAPTGMASQESMGLADAQEQMLLKPKRGGTWGGMNQKAYA